MYVRSLWHGQVPGLPDAKFVLKNKFGIFREVLVWKNLVYFMDVWYGKIWYILWTFGMFYGYLVYFMDVWYVLWIFGIHILCSFT
jgi:hypothetical protein